MSIFLDEYIIYLRFIYLVAYGVFVMNENQALIPRTKATDWLLR